MNQPVKDGKAIWKLLETKWKCCCLSNPIHGFKEFDSVTCNNQNPNKVSRQRRKNSMEVARNEGRTVPLLVQFNRRIQRIRLSYL